MRAITRTLFAGSLVSALLCSPALAQDIATWAADVDGDWNDDTKWLPPIYPDKDHPLGTTYNAFISAVGVDYTVLLNLDITLTDLTINSANATLDLNDFTMTLERDFFLSGDARLFGILGGSTGILDVAGHATIGDSTIMWVQQLRGGGGLTFNPTTQCDICDSDIDHEGDGDWTSGDLMFDRGSTFDGAAGSTFTITGDGDLFWGGAGTRPTFTTAGLLTKSTGTGTTFVDGVDLTITSTGTLEVQTGTFRTNRLTNIVGGSLNAGTFDISGVFQADGADVTALATVFTMDGPSAAFVDETGVSSGFRNLADINAGGNLTLMNGPDLAVSGGLNVNGDGLLTVEGASTSFTTGGAVNINDTSTIAVNAAGLFTAGGDTRVDATVSVQGAGSQFSVAPGFSLLNVTGGTIAGGTFDINAGVFEADDLDVSTVGSKITLTGATAQFRDRTTGQSGIRNLSAVASTGDLTLATGQVFNAVGGIGIDAGGKLTAEGAGTQINANGDVTATGNGQLNVGAGATFEVAPAFTVTNFDAGVFTGGEFNVAGTLRFNPDEPVRDIAGEVKFDTPGAQIVTHGGTSVFAPVETVRPAGRFALERGFQFATVGSLRSLGAIKVGLPSADVDSILTVNGDMNQENGTVSLEEGRLVVTGTYTISAGAVLDGIGTVEGTINNHGTISPGIAIVPPGPGGSAGVLSMLGDFKSVIVSGEVDELVLKMEVGGTIAGVQHDQLMISGMLNLADGAPEGSGVVELAVLPGYSPVDGDTYVLVTFDTRVGEFAEYRAPATAGGRFEFYYTEHSLNAVFVVPAPGAGVTALLAGLGAMRRRRR